MAIYIYHGDDEFQSRRQLANALEDFSQVEHFKSREITPENLTKASGGLFDQGNKALVLEKFFSLGKNQFKETENYLEKLSDSIDFFIWEGKRLYPNQLKKISAKKKVREFKLPNTIFKLLDSIGKENHRKLLNFLQGSFQTHPPQLIFYLIQKRLRKMILAKVKSSDLKGAGWQKRNLYNQVEKIPLDLITNWYTDSVKIEWKNKTGQLGRDLDQELVNLMVKFGEK